MKKLFTLLTLLLCVGGAWADTETVFSASPIVSEVKFAASTTTEFTSEQATITGGSVYYVNEQTKEITGVRNQSSSNAFSLTNNNTYLKIILNSALQEGDIVTATTLTNGSGESNGRGVWITSATARPNSAPACALLSISSSKKEYVSVSYTVTATDDLSGQTTIYAFRATANTTDIKSISITRPVSDTRADVTLTYSAATANANLGEAFTAPTLTVDPSAAANEVVFNSSKTSVATVNADGNVTILAAGETTITAAITGSEAYKDASASYTLTVIDPNVKTVTATFPFNTGVAGQVATVSAENVFSVTSVGVADMTYAGVGFDQDITGTKMQPVSSASDDKSQYVKFTVTPKKGITFTPTKIEFDALRWGTDGSNKLHYYAESGTTSIELGNVNPNRNGKGNGWSHYSHEISGINATSDAPFALACYVYGLANNKQISFANVVITGEYSGEAQDETMYAITTSVTPEGAGSVIQNPAGASLAEGTAVGFSATANTGYLFLNKWTVNGSEVDGATYSIASLSENVEVVAQFKKLYAVSFNAGEGDKGTTNAILGTEYSEDTYTTPAANYYIARDGYTVTGWTDGENEYGFGEEITLTGDITLSPIFTANTKTIADTGIDNVTITYGFNNTSGDPVINLENSTGYYVKKATFGGEAIDVALFIDNRDNAGIEGKRGKTNNVGRANAQVNTGSKFTIPAVSGMKVEISRASGSLDGTTIAGDAYTGAYTYTGDAETVDIIFTSDGLYINNVTVTYPKTMTYVDVTSLGYRTFASSSALDFTAGVEGLTAYSASVGADKVVTFTPINGAVPAGEGMLIKAAEGRYYIPVAQGTPATIDNKFVGVTSTTTVDGAGIFVLMDGDSGVGFYKTTAESFTVGANTAYLPASVAPARTFIALDEATAIEEIATAKAAKGECFDLQGRRVAQPQKGLYIVNGKKMVVK